MDKRQKTNALQWSVFLDFAEEHPVILTKKFDSIKAKNSYNELWNEISNTLNSMGFSKKTTDKWQKAVSDWRSKVKAKAADINQGLSQTGGGGPMPPLNDNEKRLLAILGWTSVTGTNIEELGIPTKALESTAQSGSKAEGTDIEYPGRDVSLSPPPLIWNKDLGESMTTTTNDEVSVRKNVEEGPRKAEVSLKLPKGKYQRNCNTLSTAKSRLKVKTNNELQNMQEETITVLKEMNKNLDRMATAQEKMCSILENSKFN